MEDFVYEVIVDICARTFKLRSSDGNNKIIACEDSAEFMRVLEVCDQMLEPHMIKYAELSLSTDKYMKYKISTNFCWFRGGSMIVKMYFINGMPFTFDELPEGHLREQDLIKEADKHRTFNDDEMYQYYGYLVEE